jgi:hypothetical protein
LATGSCCAKEIVQLANTSIKKKIHFMQLVFGCA